MNILVKNPLSMPMYTPLWVCSRDQTHKCIILSEELEVDDQRQQTDNLHYIGIDGNIKREYWNWNMPLLVYDNEGSNMIISKHSIELKKRHKHAVKTLITPSPCDFVMENEYHNTYGINNRNIKRVSKGDIIIIVPDVIKDASYMCPNEELFGHLGYVYAIVNDPYNAGQESDIIFDVSEGDVTLYIIYIITKEYISNNGCWRPHRTYALTTKKTHMSINLRIGHLQYTLSGTKDELLAQLKSYII